MTPLTEALVRREVGKLLRVDYQGQMICFSCLVTFVHDSFGTTYTKIAAQAVEDPTELRGARTSERRS
jgi:hypothetical protein